MVPQFADINNLPEDILLQAYNSSLAPWTSRSRLPAWPSHGVAVQRCLRCIDELKSYHFETLGITAEGRVLGTPASDEAKEALALAKPYTERGPSKAARAERREQDHPPLVSPLARPANVRLSEMSEDISVSEVETRLMHADMGLPPQTKAEDPNMPDVHQLRADKDGLTYEAAKVRNFMDMYGPGTGLDLAIQDGTVNEVQGKLISDTYKAIKLGGGFAHLEAFVRETRQRGNKDKAPLSVDRQNKHRQSELAMYAGTRGPDEVVSVTVDGEEHTFSAEAAVKAERALEDMTPGQRRMAANLGIEGIEKMRIGVASEQKEWTDKPPERTAGTPLGKSARSQDALSAVIGLGKDKHGKAYGPENNPRRGDAAKNFALYREGMTLRQFQEAGGDIGEARRDARHNRITLTVPRKD